MQLGKLDVHQAHQRDSCKTAPIALQLSQIASGASQNRAVERLHQKRKCRLSSEVFTIKRTMASPSIGPGINIVLAVIAALLFHFVGYLPDTAAQWVAENLKNALIINVVLAVFNLLPLPPLDGGRIAVGLLPDGLASPLARLEPYGMMILIGVLFILPMIGAQMGLDFSIVSHVIAVVTSEVVAVILRLTGYN